jgi:hypothetical protein
LPHAAPPSQPNGQWFGRNSLVTVAGAAAIWQIAYRIPF